MKRQQKENRKSGWSFVLWFVIFLLVGTGSSIFFKEQKLQVKLADAEEENKAILGQNIYLDVLEEGNSKQWEIEEVPYTERRGAEEFHVTMIQNEEEQYQVFIPENLYSERKINAWLQEFYMKDSKIGDELLGIKKDREYTSSEQMTLVYHTSVRLKRADDAVISFFVSTYTDGGGSHGIYDRYSINFDTRKGEILGLEDIVFDKKAFYDRVREFVKEDYRESYGKSMDDREIEELEWAIQKGWYLSGYGIHFFANGSNGLFIFSYAIPYEIIVNDIKPEYLPVSKEAEIYINEKMLQIDVNGDGRLDQIVYGNEEVVINGVTSALAEDGIELAEDERLFDDGFLKLVRDKEGNSRLEREMEVYKKTSENGFTRQDGRNYKLVYRIEGERAVFERAEFIAEES